MLELKISTGFLLSILNFNSELVLSQNRLIINTNFKQKFSFRIINLNPKLIPILRVNKEGLHSNFIPFDTQRQAKLQS